MCQRVKITSSPQEGVCEVSPSVSEHLGFPDCGNCVDDFNCDSLSGVDGLSSRCDQDGNICSCGNSAFSVPEDILESELVLKNKPTSVTFTTPSTGSVCTEESDLHHCLSIPCRHFYPRTSRGMKKVFSMFGLNLSRPFVFSRHLAFLLVIMLWSVLVEGVPIRRQYLKPERLPNCSQLPRWNGSETEGVCPSRPCVDVDEHRRPVQIIRVFCLPNIESKCSTVKGDFHCTQLFAQVETWHEEDRPEDGAGLVELWTSKNKTRTLVPSKISVEQGCICASKKAKHPNASKEKLVREFYFPIVV